MLKKDFILVQIEEMAKVIAQLFDWRNTDNPVRKAACFEKVHHALKADQACLLNESPETLHHFFDDAGERSGLMRMEIAAKLLIEESFAQLDKKRQLLLKAKQLLEYLQNHDTTFSLERISLLSEIEDLLS